MTYTVTFTNIDTGLIEKSRFFNTKLAALNWAKWLRTMRFVAETAVFKGDAGEELIERKAA
jgi:hypothetical protein